MVARPALAATSLMLSGADPAWRETLRPFVHFVTMDERQTLRVMAWSIGGVVGVLFFLNAVASSLTPLLRGPHRGPTRSRFCLASAAMRS